MGRNRIAILTGPTGVGKSEVAVDVALELGSEIISADSMAVYRRMDAATAKPSAEDRARVPHHLIDIADPAEPFTVADYRAAAVPIIETLLQKGIVPLLVGGTRLYIRALTAPFSTGPEPSAALREEWAPRPAGDLHEELQRVDPETAMRLHPADRKRIVRALEVFRTAGKTIAEMQVDSRKEGGLYDATWVALIRDREDLYRRVEARVDRMVAAGLFDEVRGFLAEGLTANTPSMQGHGYKEILRALTGDYPMDEGVRLLKRNTRRYVKYQLMWLRGMPEVHYVRADQPHIRVVQEVVSLLRDGVSRDPPHSRPSVCCFGEGRASEP